MTNDEILERFYNYLTKNYETLKKTYRQFCFLNHITYSEDTLQDTVIKVADIIKRKGLKKTDESDIADYFFKSFKFILYQEHLQQTKNKIDDNVDVFDINKEQHEYNEDEMQYPNLVSLRCERLIRENFDEIDFSIFRLRYLLKIDGKNLTFKDIKKLTKINDSRKRLVNMNRFLRLHQDEILKRN